jgi:hypothetical protein
MQVNDNWWERKKEIRGKYRKKKNRTLKDIL